MTLNDKNNDTLGTYVILYLSRTMLNSNWFQIRMMIVDDSEKKNVFLILINKT